ncbi:MAG: acylphosphatase [Acidobacteria bacterium]|nr:acylphosphatase [Acidobacteriota bacterium]
MKTAIRYFVEGRVQGVGFRFFVERIASDLGLQGYVRNRYDGRVEVYAIGEERVLEQFRKQLRTGPAGSRVDRIEEHAASMETYKTFQIEGSL